MSKNRKPRLSRHTRPAIALEALEDRLLLSTQASDVAPPSAGFTILTQDEPLNGAYAVPSSISSSGQYTLRQLVGYYDYYYNSTQDWVINLGSQTYTLSNINGNLYGSKFAGRNENQNQVGDLDLFPTSYTGIGKLIFEGPSSTSYATITCSQITVTSNGNSTGTPIGTVALDRIFHVLDGASLGLDNIVVTGGLALDDSDGQSTDALGGGILVDSGASLSLTNTQVINNYAIGTAGPNVVGVTYSGREGAGFNAAGGGIYGSAGSSISIDSSSVISNNAIQGGHGGNISESNIGHGGNGGNAYGAGIAINAPSSTSGGTISNVPTTLTIEGGAKIASNLINQTTSSGHINNHGATGGSYLGGLGGNGGNAYGAGLYMATGQLNLNGGSSASAVAFNENSEVPGPGFTSSVSGSDSGSAGVADGAGADIEPGQLIATNSPTSNGILKFSNNVAGNTSSGLYLPPVTTATDTGYTSPNGAWNLRTAVAAANPLAASGMNVTLNLPSSTLSLASVSGITAPSPANNGFETPSLGNANFDYYGGTTTGSWTFSGEAGISNNSSGFTGGNPDAPQGSQVAFLQGTGAMSQTLSDFTPGLYYTISFYAAQRSGYPASSVNVTMDGVSIGTFAPGSSLYQVEMTLPFDPGSGNHTLAFTGIDPGGEDQTVFVDDVQILPANAGSLFVGNTGTGKLTILGGGEGSSVISATGLGTSAFTLSNANVELSNLTVSGASSSVNGGGVAMFGGVVTVTNASIAHNSSTLNGGGIYQSGGSLTIKNALLTANSTSGSGGGLYFDQESTASVSGTSKILDDQASVYGGGVFALNATVQLSGITISQNTAEIGGGGGIDAAYGTFSISGSSSIQDNSTGGNGGGIVAVVCAFTMTGGKVSGNSATGTGGGGVAATSGTANLTSVAISGNSASASSGTGGGLYQAGGTVTLKTVTVSGNTGHQGGGVGVNKGTLQIKQSTISGNAAQNGGYGGGVYAEQNAAVNLLTANILSNTSSSTSAFGGGIYQSTGTLTVQNGSKIKNNRASQGGGAYITGATATVNSSFITGNYATTNGAGLLSWNGTLNLTGGSVATNNVQSNGNIAGFGGGLYQNNGGTLNLASTLVKNNSAAYGGGILCDASSFKDNGGSILANTASVAGGGVFALANSQAVNFTNAQVSSNRINAGGSAYGGGLYILGGTLNTNGFTVQNNDIEQVATTSTSQVSLSSYYNAIGMVSDGSSFSGSSLDNDGNALSANLVGSSLARLGGFNLASPGQNNVVHGQGQTISVSGAGYNTLNLAALGDNGAQTNQTFTLQFTDGSSQQVSQSLSDWWFPSYFTGESLLSIDSHYDQSNGSEGSHTVHVYGYSFAIPSGKTLSGVTLPNNTNVLVLAMNLTNQDSIEGGGIYASGTTVNFNGGSSVTTAVSGNVLSGDDGGSAVLQNSGFENPSLGSGNFEYLGGTTTGGWTFGGDAGISNNNSGFTGSNPSSPQGTQVGILQRTGSISQTVSGFTPGESYKITFYAAQRAGYPSSSVNVTLDGNSIGTISPSSSSYQSEATNSFTPGPGTHTLTFTGVDPGGDDQTVFIDEIRIVPADTDSVTAIGGGIAITNGPLNDNSLFNFENNEILGTNNGVGGGIAFFANSSYDSSCYTTAYGNTAPGGGNDYAFAVTNTGDDNYTSSENGTTDMNYFTGGGGSLRSAINYAENYMNGNTNNKSMAIMLTPGQYSLNSSYGQIVTSVPTGDSVTIVPEGGPAAINANGQFRDFDVQGSGGLTLQDVTVTGGYNNSQGGGIYQQSGTLTLNSAIITGSYAGQGGTAGDSFGATAGQHDQGNSGANGASGYGGGIFMNGGTLNLLNNAEVAGNTVQGQNGGNGQKGGSASSSTQYNWSKVKSTCRGTQGGNGGNGGSGGAALGGGIYQAGGTLNSSSGANPVSNNVSEPGNGGAAGSGGNSASSSGPLAHCSESGGNAGSSGANGASCTNYEHAGGGTVFSGNATVTAQSASGGLYSSSGTLSIDDSWATSTTPAATTDDGSSHPLLGVIVELHASDGTLIAKAITDSEGRYRFKTDFSGMGYVQLERIPSFTIVNKGTRLGNGVASAINPYSLQSDVIQFLAGTPVNEELSFGLSAIRTSLRNTANSVALRIGNNGSFLWKDQILPKNYKAGFTVTYYDLNNDHTPDYILLTKAGPPRLFFVDGRTGKVTPIAGTVSASLRAGMVVQQADVSGDATKELVISPDRDRSGKISVIDLETDRVLWTSRQTISGKMTVAVVGASDTNRINKSDILLTSISDDDNTKTLDGATGQVIDSDADSYSSVHSSRVEAGKSRESASRFHASSVVRKKTSLMTRSVKFRR